MNNNTADLKTDVLIRKWRKLKEQYSDEELIEAVIKHRRYLMKMALKKWALRFILIGIIFLLGCLAYYCLNKYLDLDMKLLIVARYITVYWLGPFINFGEAYKESCLVSNPYHDPFLVYESDCEGCMDMPTIPEIKEHDLVKEGFYREYLAKHKLLVIRQGNELPNWWLAADKCGHLKNISTIHDFYLSKDEFLKTVACDLNTNVPVPYPNQKLLLRYLNDGIVTDKNGWFAVWENCGQSQRRAFRAAYARPSFLPDSLDISKPSWVLMSQGYKNATPVVFDFKAPAAFICQVRGSLRFKLLTLAPCDKICKENYLVEISEGDCLLTTDLLYDVEIDFYSKEDKLNLALVFPIRLEMPS